MGKWSTLVVSHCISLAVLYLALSWQVRSDQAQDFLTSLEDAVIAIAQSAIKNYESTCDLLDTCRSEQNCSKRECFPLEGQHYDCVYVYNFTVCAASSGSQCNRASVDFSRSVARLPGNTSVSFSDAKSMEAAFAPTVCTQRELDATFKAHKFSYSNQSFFVNMHFGAADGVHRSYPSKEYRKARCNTYDPRVRPWYVNAISVIKDIVVVLDTGYSMAKEDFFLNNTSLATAKKLTRTLAQNLSTGDTLTVVSVNASGAFRLGRLSTSDDALETGESLSLLLGNPALDGTESLNKTPSQFSAALMMADSTVGQALKIIMVFTNSDDNNIPTDLDLINSTLMRLQAAGVGVFAYDLASESTSSLWDNTLCNRSNISSTNNQESRSDPEQNPSLFLHSYYSFLARARTKANKGNVAFWTKPHLSAGDMGEVMTVSYPAISSDTMLVGVAAIDVQTGGLPTQLKDNLERLLDSNAYQQKTSVPIISAFADTTTTCLTGYLKACTNSNKTEPLQPFCYSSTEPASDQELHSILCCNSKGCLTGHHGGSVPLVVWIVTSIALLGAIGCIYIAFKVISKRARAKFSPFQLAIPWEELNIATNGFADGNIIGRGAFGVVYRGVLREQTVAVKRLQVVPTLDKSHGFQAELRVNIKISRHPNLVELKGACFRGLECYLVYELVENGDLYQWLWPEQQEVHTRGEVGPIIFLTWNKRKEIAHGIAEGLHYLHKGLLPDLQVFHLDLKPQNILLGKNLSPKLADFGISQLYEPGRTLDIVTVKAGTIGYMAPEVLHGYRHANSKMDVYSFGVVLLQLVSGRKINDIDQDLGWSSIYQWARNLVNHDNMDQIIDNHLFESVQYGFENNLVQNCQRMIEIAMCCTELEPDRRPEMDQILRELSNFEEVKELECTDYLKNIQLDRDGRLGSCT